MYIYVYRQVIVTEHPERSAANSDLNADSSSFPSFHYRSIALLASNSSERKSFYYITRSMSLVSVYVKCLLRSMVPDRHIFFSFPLKAVLVPTGRSNESPFTQLCARLSEANRGYWRWCCHFVTVMHQWYICYGLVVSTPEGSGRVSCVSCAWFTVDTWDTSEVTLPNARTHRILATGFGNHAFAVR